MLQLQQNEKKRAPHQRRTQIGFCSVPQVLLHQLLEQLVPVQLADEGAGVVVVGDIGGVLREDVADDLVDGGCTPSPEASYTQRSKISLISGSFS